MLLAFANSAGVGGGGLLIPLLIVFNAFDGKMAAEQGPFYNLIAGLIRYCMNLSKKSPSVKHKTIIDYDLVAIFVPLNLVGSLIGGILNIVFPNIFISVSLFLFLVFVSYKLFMKGIKTRKKESTIKSKKEAEASMLVTEASIAHQQELNKMEPEVRLEF